MTIEQKPARRRLAKEISLSLPLPTISENTYNSLLEKFGVKTAPNSATAPEEKTWRQEFAVVNNRIEQFTENAFNLILSRNGNIIKKTGKAVSAIIPIIEDHFNNDILMGNAVLFGFGVVLRAYDEDSKANPSLNTLSKQTPESLKDIARVIFPESGRPTSPLQDIPKIPEDNIYLKQLVERIAGINKKENGQYQISDPLVMLPVEFYMGAVYAIRVLEDSWNKDQADKKTPKTVAPVEHLD